MDSDQNPEAHDAPQYSAEEYRVHEERPSRAGLIAVVLVLALLALAGYALHEHNSAQALAAQSAQMTASLASTHTEIDALNSKLTSMEAERQAAEKAAAERIAAAQVQQQHRAVRSTV